MSSLIRKPHILDLPNEMLVEIFKHLTASDRRKASEVGHCWYSILNDHSFLKNKTVVIKEKNITSSSSDRDIVKDVHTFLKSQTYYCSYHFYLTNMSKVTNEFWVHLGGNIKSLTISSKLCYLDIVIFLQSCKRLEKLNFYCCTFAPPDCNSIMKFEKMHYELPYLKYLNLSYCIISDAVIYTIVKNSPAIETLKVYWCTSYKGTDETEQYYYVENPNTSQTTVEDSNNSQKDQHVVEAEALSLTNFTMSYILNFIKSRCTKIKHLKLSGVDNSALRLMTDCEGLSLESLELEIDDDEDNVTKEVFSEFLKKQCLLRKLEFDYFGNLADDFLLAVCRHLIHLEHLSVSYVPEATDSGIRELHRLKKLMTLSFPYSSSITNDGLMEALGIGQEKNYSLNNLNITFFEINEDCVISLAERLPNLCILDLSYTPPNSVTDKSLRVIIKNLTKLEILNLICCKSLYTLGAYKEDVCRHNAEDNGRNVTESIGLFSLKRLRELDLEGCSNITSKSLEYSLRSPRLATLNLSGCTITHETITQIVKNCPNIENLRVRDCENVTDKSTKVIMTGLNKLKSFDNSGCEANFVLMRSGRILYTETVGRFWKFRYVADGVAIITTSAILYTILNEFCRYWYRKVSL